jgi:hypothetical protein
MGTGPRQRQHMTWQRWQQVLQLLLVVHSYPRSSPATQGASSLVP